MEISDDVNLDQQSNRHNNVRFGSLSRKRSSNWRPPGKANFSLNSSQHYYRKGLHMKPEPVADSSLGSINTQQKQHHTYESTRLNKDYTFIGDMETNYKRKNENRLEWPPSRHKNSSCLTSRDTSVYKNISDFNIQQKMCITSPKMSNSKLHSASDIHSKCCEEHVNGDDFMFRKISNLFFRRNQIRWQYNFFKTLFIDGGSMMRYKKTMSYFGGASTVMLLLIFSLLISGPGEAYPVEGGTYIYHYSKWPCDVII